MSTPTEPTTPAVIWMDEGGVTLCDRHISNELKAAIKRRPKARSHTCDRSRWYLQSPADFAAFEELAGVPMDCEACRV